MIKRSLPFLALLLIFAACGPKTPPRVAAPELDTTRILQEIQIHLKNQEVLQGARGYAKVKLKIQGKGASAEEAVFISLPDRFRFETLDDMGNRRFVLLGGARRFYAREEGRGLSFRELGIKDLRRFLPWASSLENTLGLLVGKMPPLNFQDARVYSEAEAKTYRIVLPRAEIIWDDGRRLILSFAWKEEHGKVAYRYDGGEFAQASFRRTSMASSKDSLLTPMRVRLADLKTKNWVEIRYLSLEWNPEFSPSLFQVNPLEDAAGFDEQD